MFKALILNQQDKTTQAHIGNIDSNQLPEGDVTVAVEYSSLNYKDGLAITGAGKIIRQFPMVPGIDFAGTVITSSNSRYQAGDPVVLTGWGVGENHWGGMAQQARVKADWLVPLPAGLNAEQAMFIGTAGLTAMLCVQALEDAGITPESGEILVTGASGGVGSVAVTLLSKLGYRVAAVTGRAAQNAALLKQLGAESIIERSELEEPAKPLEKQRWAGAIDTVGSNMLAKVLTQMDYNGAVAACGLAGGFDLPTTVMPFILRNVRLLGVDSVYCPVEKRQQAWQRLSQLLPASFYQQAGQTISLEQVPEFAQAIIKGQVTGRTLVKLSD
ncbi:MDR family oxidoreductase [Photobacterium halotolerans]|uniref:Quinone oxidoreductase n=1 Tax=Photobacterium halotolerans TaxID=265726 RepID=A0A0F5VA59_9GAMM|nr:MDR family oxidoreductase [Photobacterium halotolerans]KKC98394.1 quinone oxidoreductase [Photobacterium halotolerans]